MGEVPKLRLLTDGRERYVIIVLGRVDTTPETVDEALALSLAHVRRSRREPGCLAHAVHRDVEDPYRLVFVERWADREALDAHFRVPESSAFVEALTPLASGDPAIEIYTTSSVSPPGPGGRAT